MLGNSPSFDFRLSCNKGQTLIPIFHVIRHQWVKSHPNETHAAPSIKTGEPSKLGLHRCMLGSDYRNMNFWKFSGASELTVSGDSPGCPVLGHYSGISDTRCITSSDMFPVRVNFCHLHLKKTNQYILYIHNYNVRNLKMYRWTLS